jgi:hypothetical protein
MAPSICATLPLAILKSPSNHPPNHPIEAPSCFPLFPQYWHFSLQKTQCFRSSHQSHMYPAPLFFLLFLSVCASFPLFSPQRLETARINPKSCMARTRLCNVIFFSFVFLPFPSLAVARWLHGWTDGRMDGWMNDGDGSWWQGGW